jgi:crotonobetainyl-CoA:carnitine CoA-transferase CaiB-like acyl-CoA transferase|tara:strand:+ start:87 stop:1259 length:1173 start_codon:yes stop_codon:yes gene_type:complete
MQYPLEGVKVLDFSRAVAGPFAGRLLADLGADVVKVEPPGGDDTSIHGRKVQGISGMFSQQNAGKRNICLDLRSPDAVWLVKELAAVADIVLENYRPGVMDRLGIDFATLSAVNAKLIMLSISGYGHDSPEAHRPSYAPVVHAEVGLMHRMAQRNATPPGDLPLSVADTNASLHGVIAVLAALNMRHLTGMGQHIDMSMMDATFATDDRAHFELENVPDTLPVCPIVDLPFGRVFIATDMKLLFRKLHRYAGLADPTPDGADLATKIDLRNQAIEHYLRQCESLSQFAELMDTIDMPWGQVRDPHDLEEQPTLKHRRMIVQIDDRAGGVRPIADSPYRFSNASSGVRGPAAHRGEHNRQVLKDWLGLSDAKIEARVESSMLKSDPSEVRD